MTCRCGNTFGKTYEVDGVFVGAQVGGLVVESLHGKCAQCGRGIHISVSSKAMMKLFSHYGEVSPIAIEISE
jgi:hypothetical protein